MSTLPTEQIGERPQRLRFVGVAEQQRAAFFFGGGEVRFADMHVDEHLADFGIVAVGAEQFHRLVGTSVDDEHREILLANLGVFWSERGGAFEKLHALGELLVAFEDPAEAGEVNRRRLWIGGEMFEDRLHRSPVLIAELFRTGGGVDVAVNDFLLRFPSFQSAANWSSASG